MPTGLNFGEFIHPHLAKVCYWGQRTTQGYIINHRKPGEPALQHAAQDETPAVAHRNLGFDGVTSEAHSGGLHTGSRKINANKKSTGMDSHELTTFHCRLNITPCENSNNGPE